MNKEYLLFKVFHTGVFIVCEELSPESANLYDKFGSPEFGHSTIEACVEYSKHNFTFRHVETIVLPELSQY